ncbi:hypothetical protein KY362_02805 [Candidatus Woesearchaeota archaeon]|nr:hypothetical protein [Candidatus Woesearchaeota archaeon]
MAIKPVNKKTAKPAATKTAAKPATMAANVSKDEQIGFHKGALSTLAKEREEMLKILSIVEQLMQMHVAGLKELGVDLEKMAQQAQAAAPRGKAASLEKQLR